MGRQQISHRHSTRAACDAAVDECLIGEHHHSLYYPSDNRRALLNIHEDELLYSSIGCDVARDHVRNRF